MVLQPTGFLLENQHGFLSDSGQQWFSLSRGIGCIISVMMSKYRNSITEGFVLIEKARTWESAIFYYYFYFLSIITTIITLLSANPWINGFWYNIIHWVWMVAIFMKPLLLITLFLKLCYCGFIICLFSNYKVFESSQSYLIFERFIRMRYF